MSIQETNLTAIANAIRAKEGSTGEIPASNFADRIAAIKTGIDTSDATASASEILSSKTAYVKGAKITGSMANQGAKTTSLNCGGTYTIPAGYHNGSGKVTANSLASQTSATATASDILSNKTAYVNGSKVTGTMANQGAKTQALNCGGSYIIPAGYHNGSGKVMANSLASQTAATATAADIASGKTAWVNGGLITGTKAFPVDVASALQTVWPVDMYQKTLVSPLPNAFAAKKVIFIVKKPGYETATYPTSYCYCYYSDPFTLPSNLDTATTIGNVNIHEGRLTPTGFTHVSTTNDTVNLAKNRTISLTIVSVGTNRYAGYLIVV